MDRLISSLKNDFPSLGKKMFKAMLVNHVIRDNTFHFFHFKFAEDIIFSPAEHYFDMITNVL